jgi:uncharacterized protein with FMN-binding domain
MKRALLIAGGTVGGLGAVLSITPPQLNAHGALGGLSNIASAANSSVKPAAQNTTTTPTATTTQAATTPVATVVKKKTVRKKKVVLAKATVRKKPASHSTPKVVTPPPATNSATATPLAIAQTAAPVTKKVSGTFTGNVVNVNYGNVQVQITLVNGKITDAQALQAPSGRSDRYTQYALPILRTQTLAAQGSNIQGASGASYTSYGWYTSLQVALAKAGL